MRRRLELIIRLLIIAAVAVFLIAWIRAVIDVVRRPDLSPAARGGWIVGMLVLPFIGLAVYAMLRPADAQLRRR